MEAIKAGAQDYIAKPPDSLSNLQFEYSLA